MNFDCISCFRNKSWGSMTRLSLFSFTSPITSDCIFISFYSSLTCDHSYCLCCCLAGFALTWESELLMVTWFSSKCYISFFDTYLGIFFFVRQRQQLLNNVLSFFLPLLILLMLWHTLVIAFLNIVNISVLVLGCLWMECQIASTVPIL